ncbi:GAF domain-containing protein [Marinilabiliaceae bacterium JC040]|nr:GAF domain-containing protein [Marinilabiliaceae bacterium JC040]
MAENLIISEGNREEKYKSLIPQIKSLNSFEEDEIANMANTVAALKETFNFFWIGFYRVIKDELVLGPFQGPIACTRIKKGKGVCGTSWSEAKTILVEDVDKFPGHIACSSASKSEIVVPIIKDGIVTAIIDIDSDKLNDFSEIDTKYVEEIAKLF